MSEQDSGQRQSALELPDVREHEDQQQDDQLGEQQGLSGRQARERLDRYGANELGEQRRSPVLDFLRHFWGPIPWMIEAAAILSAISGQWPDTAVILALLVSNGVVGFWQEHQANSAIEQLQQQVAPRARVRRDEQWQDVPAREVVPGDLVQLDVDEIVPADGVVLSGASSTDESVLTGESLPVSKEAGDAVYSGSSNSRGRAGVRVTATGTRTRFGRTAALVAGEAPPARFQRAVARIGRYLLVLSVALVIAIFAISLLRGNPLTTSLELALVVLIASIPVALPTVLSVTMAAGARVLARSKAIVSRLPALEELAGTQVLLVDKTGTITREEISVYEAFPLQDESSDVLAAAALASEPEGGDPIDEAVFDSLDEGALSEHERSEFEPFDPQLKRTEARVRGPSGEFRVAKGAVQSVLELCESDEQTRQQVEQHTREYAAHGMRTLLVARNDEQQWRPVGVLALRNPPRDDAAETLAQAADLGVEVRMLTGDRPEIGQQVADEVGLGGEVRAAESVREADDEQLVRQVHETAGFAEVVPEDKHRIATALQERDWIVGMTGDGVNDTPALRKSEVGIAVSGATDAARAASDVVLTEPGLAVVVEALRRSRETSRRMVNYAVYRVSETIRVVVFVALTVAALGLFPLSPVQVILLALLNDLAILSIAYDRAAPARQPARWGLRPLFALGSSLGLVGVVSSFLLVLLALGPLGVGEQELTTLVYLKLSVAGHLTYFATRTRGPLWASRPATIVLVAVLGTQLLATAIAVSGLLMPALSWGHVGVAWAWSLVWVFALDGVKLLIGRRVSTGA